MYLLQGIQLPPLIVKNSSEIIGSLWLFPIIISFPHSLMSTAKLMLFKYLLAHLARQKTVAQLLKNNHRAVWNPKVYYRGHKCRNEFLFSDKQINATPSHSVSLRPVLILSFDPRTFLEVTFLQVLFPKHSKFCSLIPMGDYKMNHTTSNTLYVIMNYFTCVP
jgi:hypothetical protein